MGCFTKLVARIRRLRPRNIVNTCTFKDAVAALDLRAFYTKFRRISWKFYTTLKKRSSKKSKNSWRKNEKYFQKYPVWDHFACMHAIWWNVTALLYSSLCKFVDIHQQKCFRKYFSIFLHEYFDFYDNYFLKWCRIFTRFLEI